METDSTSCPKICFQLRSLGSHPAMLGYLFELNSGCRRITTRLTIPLLSHSSSVAVVVGARVVLVVTVVVVVIVAVMVAYLWCWWW